MLAWIVAALVVACCAAVGDRNAYVTIHYENTAADDEYILGVRVLLKSLQPLRHPFLILISDNVSQRSREIFQSEGATLIPIKNIKNPFSNMPLRFSFALNKLHLWNLTDYDRLVYFDADNIAVKHDMVDELFLCGHFCVVYMNPCHFHTGVIVVKPNVTVFHELLNNLASTGSYDGADQGFLSEYFGHGCSVAPIFNAKKGKSEARFNQLHIAYNMHALYYFARGNIDVYRCGPAANSNDELPVATLGFPVPPIIKPWYYWTPLMGHSDAWHAIRETLSEPELYLDYIGRMLIVIVLFISGSIACTPFVHTDHSIPAVQRVVRRLGPTGAGVAVGLVACALTNRIVVLFVPTVFRPFMGLSLYCLAHVALLTLSARVLANVVFGSISTPSAPLVPKRRLIHVAGALVFICTMKYWRVLFNAVLGYGLHTVIICFIIGVAAVVSTQLYLFIYISKHSPLFHSS